MKGELIMSEAKEYPKEHKIVLRVFAEVDRDGKSSFVCVDHNGHIKKGNLDQVSEFVSLARNVFTLNKFEVITVKIELDHPKQIFIHITPHGSQAYLQRPLTESEAGYLVGGCIKPLTE